MQKLQYIGNHLRNQSKDSKEEIAKQVQMLEELELKQMKLKSVLKTKQAEVTTLKDDNRKIMEKLTNVTAENEELKNANEKLELTNKKLKEVYKELEHTVELFDTIDGGSMPTKAGTKFLKNKEKDDKDKDKENPFPMLQQNKCRFCNEFYQDQKTLMDHLKKVHYCSNCKTNIKGHVCGKF